MAPLYKSPKGEQLDIPAKGTHVMELLGWKPVATKPPAAAKQPEDTKDPDETLPSGNASLEAWHTYALADGVAEDELDGLTRNQIRDLFIE